ncbi:MAG TPA: ABC transporter permease [Candidatus Sulfotelmatobacter sp.]|nr:ABC transporter permease [Candidatus Sulfotelmatobacter sp.]
MNGLVQDLRYALRKLRKSPAFAVVAIITLTLGIGVNTSMFSLVNAVILKESPVSHPAQLVFPAGVRPDGADNNFAYKEFEEIRNRNESLSGAFAFDTTRFLASVNGQTDYVFGQCVSGNFFSVLGVKPTLGRALTQQDDQAGQPPVVVISHDYWKRRFASDPGALNSSVVIKKIPFQVVGVAPRSFRGIELGDAVDIWMPITYWPQVRLGDHLMVGIMGRLKPGTTIAQASAELGVIDTDYAARKLDPNEISQN